MSSRSRRQNFFLILTLGILNALTPFSIDMYLPSFPSIAQALGVTVARVALSVSTYFIGFALGQIVYGPLLDRFGRKPPVYFGLSLYILATFGCMFANSIEALLFFRFLSATGGCAASVAATAMVRDFFPPEAAPRLFSLLMLVLSASPLLAPSVGSLLVSILNWRAIFGVLAALGALNLVLTYLLPPGQAPDPGVRLHWRPIFAGFRNILRNEQFATYTLAGALSFTGLFVYVAGSPALFMDTFHLSAQAYGAVFAALTIGMIGGGQLNLLLTRRFAPQAIFRRALQTQVILALLFFVGTWFQFYGLVWTMIFIFGVLVSAGISYPNAAALALAPLSKNIGSASALLGFVQLGIGATTSAAVGLLKVDGCLPTAATICASSVLALAILSFRNSTLNAPTA
jgi:DHA1 family bicyclomycin/chloramphenicol resistance-like MFS transporter